MKFVFDLDGTICFKGQPVSDALLKVLEEMVEQGHEVVLLPPGRFAICFPFFMSVFIITR